MNTARRSLAVVGAVLAIVMPPAPGWAAKTTTTTVPPPAPGQDAIAPDSIVNSWSLSPAESADPNQPGGRSSLSYSAAPGTEVQDAVTIYNFSNVPLVFRVFATDAFNNAQGNFDVLPSMQKPTDVGSWVQLAQENISLEAKKQATIPFTVRIPRQARPGDHSGAILASSAVAGTGPDGKTVSVDRRTGSRLYIRVAGAVHPELAITRIKTTYHPKLNPLAGSVDLKYRVENTGNVRLGGRHGLTASGLLGLGSKGMRTMELPEILPGQGVEFEAHLDGVPATMVAFSRVRVTPNGEGAKDGPVSRGAVTLAFPLTAAAAVLIAFLARHARRSYRRHEADGMDAGPQVQPR